VPGGGRVRGLKVIDDADADADADAVTGCRTQPQ
jgi:hypothetical protein